MSTFGPAYNEKRDGKRIRRQLDDVRDHMLDGAWRSLPQIASETRHPEASVSAQLRHLRKERFGRYRVEKKRASDGSGLWLYRLLPPLPDPRVPLFRGAATA
jgi:hypothetical protein